MDTSQMGNLIGFDARAQGTTPGAVNRGRRATDRAEGLAFAEVYDLAAYAATGSRAAARLASPSADGPQRPAAPASLAAVPAGVPGPAPSIDELAAERLYLHLLTGARPTASIEDAGSASTSVLRLVPASAPIAALPLGPDWDGPQVA